MAEFDYFNQLKGKVQELRMRKDEIQSDVMNQRMQMSQLDEQIAQLQREKQRISLDVQAKDQQVKNYTTLIDQSDEALNKMMQSTQKLSDTLTTALNNNLWSTLVFSLNKE